MSKKKGKFEADNDANADEIKTWQHDDESTKKDEVEAVDVKVQVGHKAIANFDEEEQVDIVQLKRAIIDVSSHAVLLIHCCAVAAYIAAALSVVRLLHCCMCATAVCAPLLYVRHCCMCTTAVYATHVDWFCRSCCQRKM